MSEFKVGDRVRCIDDDGWYKNLTVGKEYVITTLSRPYIRITDDEGLEESGFAAHRFKLVTDERQALSDAMDLMLKYDIGRVRGGEIWYYGKANQPTLCAKGLILDDIFPPSPTAQELEISRIETEMRALADSLAKLKA